jgi:hypothetical protein
MFNLGRWSAAWACFGMLLYPAMPLSRAAAAEPSPVASPAPAAEQAPSALAKAALDVSFIPAAATVAIVLHPEPLLTGPNAEWMPVEVITAAGIQQLGIDPVQVREAIMCIVPPSAKTPQAEPGMGTVVRFSKPYDKAAFLAKLGGKEEITAEGTTIYQLGGPDKFCVTLPDAQTIIFGVRTTVLEMLTAKDVDSPLVKLLKNSDCSATYTVLASLDAMRDLITAALVKMPPLPPPLDQFRKAPMLVSSAKVQLDLASGADFSIVLHAVDDEAAGELLELMNNGLALGKQIVLGQMQQQLRSRVDDPVQQATAKYANRIVTHMFDLVKPVRTGRNVKIALHSDGGVALIGVMVALLLPAVQSARSAARRMQSSNNLKQIALAMLSYETTNRRYPARAIFDKNGKPLLSWRVQILPYLDEGALYKEFHLDEPWDSEHNKPLIAKMPRVYANPDHASDGKTSYLVPVGPGTVFEGDKGLRISQIADGASNTILAVEGSDDRAVIWTKPDDLPVDLAKPMAGLENARGPGFQAAFCDGSVHYFSSSVDVQVLKALFTYAGGEAVRAP